MTTPIAEPPEELSDKARNLWREVVETERLRPAEMEKFDQALRALDRADELAKAIAVAGVEVKDRFGITKANPLLEHEVRSRNQFARLMAQLNLADRDDPDDVAEPTAAGSLALSTRWRFPHADHSGVIVWDPAWGGELPADDPNFARSALVHLDRLAAAGNERAAAIAEQWRPSASA